MDFFQQQEFARKATRRLILLYILALLGTCLVIHLGVAALIAWLAGEFGSGDHAFHAAFAYWIRQPGLFLTTFAATVLFIGIPSLWKAFELRHGGAAVAYLMGGRFVPPATTDPLERRLRNVIEEMSIASGSDLPAVFVLDHEPSMNAFAAGYGSHDAAIVVTLPLLRTLNRDELQAVVAHEFSHILSGDMRLNIRLLSILHGLFILSIIGTLLIRSALHLNRGISGGSRRGGKKGDGLGFIILGLFLLGVLLWVAGSLGHLLGKLIQAAVSRQREFHADASATQFTRNPSALANALILCGAGLRRFHNPRAVEISHMFFTSALATHPPVKERVKRLDPSFDGDIVKARNRLKDARPTTPQTPDDDAGTDALILNHITDGLAGGTLLARGTAPTPATTWPSPAERDLLRDPVQATACIYAALLPDTPHTSPISQISKSLNSQIADAVGLWQARLHATTLTQRRVACELAINSLLNITPHELETFCDTVDHLIAADGETAPFEFAICCLIRRRLQHRDAPVHAPRLSPSVLAPDISRVLSLLASFGHTDPDTLRTAFHAGAQRLRSLTGPLTLMEDAPRDIPALDASLSRISRLAPLHKKEFMLACQATTHADLLLSDLENLLLHAIADAVDAIGWNLKPRLPTGRPP